MRERGFTLIEILVALTMLSVGLLAVAPMFVIAARQNAGGANAGVVGALAVERMEQLRAAPYDTLSAGGSLTSNVTDYADTSTAGYVVRWQITDGATLDGGLRIAVRATSNGSAVGRARSLTLESIRVGD